MDGEITSTVDGSEIPTTDNQSTFGPGFEYQYGADTVSYTHLDVYKRQAQSTFILPAPKGRRCESAFALLSHQKVTKRL